MRLLTALSLFGFALLFAAESAASQVIHACVKPNGALRVVSTDSDCNHNETPILWNVQGAQGDTGEPGIVGESGPEGPPGSSLHVFDINGTDLGLFMDRTTLGLSQPRFRVLLEDSEIIIELNALDGTLFVPGKILFFGEVRRRLPRSHSSGGRRNASSKPSLPT